MKIIIYLLYLPCLIAVISISACVESNREYDIVIYGATSAGISAAVQAKRMGKRIIVIEPSGHIGGLTSGGLGATDIGNKQVIGGISREFYQRVAKIYANPKAWNQQKPEEYFQHTISEPLESMWTFEPKVAAKVFRDLIHEYDIKIVLHERLNLANGVEKVDGVIHRITMESGKSYSGKIFIDASYEGDLMALSGIEYTVGREPNSKYREKLNGVQKKLGKYHQFPDGVDPYVIKGDSSSGLLPHINTESGQEGEGDKRVQGYCFRMCLTDVADNRIKVEKPKGYNEREYELLFRAIEAGYKGPFFIMSNMPNRKTDSNNKGPVSSDFISMNYDYPEGDYETRERIIQAHETYQKGLLWTLSYHPRIPEDIRSKFSKWGLPKDEFEKNGHWTPQLYIREARRMRSDFIMTEHHCTQDSISADQSIGMGAYTMDSHHMQRYINENGHVKNEGDVEVGGFGPYPISYRAIIPKREECTNLLVPVCLSASHIAFGSIRMEPVFMILGQSAATAASIAIDQKVSVQEVPYQELQKILLTDKQILTTGDSPQFGQRKFPELKLLQQDKIWDKAPHNAFTDLFYAKDRWFCVFREGTKHASPDGSIRIISSADGENWESAALLSAEGFDLRDAKITQMPSGKLMINGAGALHDRSVHTHQSMAWFSDDGYSWSEQNPIADPDFWLWRVSWHKKNAYGFGYATSENRQLRLYKSSDGKNYATLVADLGIEGYYNETSIVFRNDTAFCLLRKDGTSPNALLGTSTAPYTKWEWKDLGVRIGGPHMIVLPDGKFLAAVRLYGGKDWHPARTSLCWLDVHNGKLTEALELPSGGDTSYAGMVIKDGILWVSYYSSHEGKTSIYLAKVSIA